MGDHFPILSSRTHGFQNRGAKNMELSDFQTCWNGSILIQFINRQEEQVLCFKTRILVRVQINRLYQNREIDVNRNLAEMGRGGADWG